jgi:hypothetical protein
VENAAKDPAESGPGEDEGVAGAEPTDWPEHCDWSGRQHAAVPQAELIAHLREHDGKCHCAFLAPPCVERATP